MPKSLIEKIESQRVLTLQAIGRNERQHLQYLGLEPPPTKEAGFYWLYTNYTPKELLESVKGTKRAAVDLPLLARAHDGIANVCDVTEDGFRLVYNGSAGDGYLRSRISQHFNSAEGTGSLHILGSSLNDIERWRVSYVTTSMLSDHRDQGTHSYKGLHAKHYERLWRLQYGWPLFCTY